MNPYRAKSTKERQETEAAKNRLWLKTHGGPALQKVPKFYAVMQGERITTFGKFKKTLDKVRGMSDRQLNEAIKKRELPKRLGFENDTPSIRHRKERAFLVAAGRAKFRDPQTKRIIAELLKTGTIKGNIGRTKELPIIFTLYEARLIKVTPLVKGRRIEVIDRERLGRVLREEKIIY